MGCLCVTQQSFAQGCSPLPYILPPNRPARPSCLHGNKSLFACMCVTLCVCVCPNSPPSSPLVRQRSLTPPPFPPLSLLYLECFLTESSAVIPWLHHSDLRWVFFFYLSSSSILLPLQVPSIFTFFSFLLSPSLLIKAPARTSMKCRNTPHSPLSSSVRGR